MHGKTCLTNGQILLFMSYFKRALPWSSLVIGDEGWIGPSRNMQQMHGIIPKLFDCWADLVAHTLLLKSSMALPMSMVS